MPIFPENPQNKPDDQCRDWVQRLRTILNVKRKLSSTLHGKEWGSTFAALRREKTAERVERTLSWYIKHVGEEFCPHAYSPRAFRLKFDQIERAMLTDDNPVEEIEPRNLDLAKRLINERLFPIEIACKLPLLVQRTRDNWNNFLEGALFEHSLTARETNFIQKMVFNYQTNVFVENWMIMLSDKYGRHNSFTGNVMNLIFKPSHAMFRDSFWRSWSQTWCHDPEAFDELLVTLTKEK